MTVIEPIGLFQNSTIFRPIFVPEKKEAKEAFIKLNWPNKIIHNEKD